ncbi:MAG: hypothetical protein RLZZ28_995, partial [Bacteroidota bacterium]
MKKYLLFISLFYSALAQSQTTENVIIITTDGFRWQELFGGMEKSIGNDKRFNQDDSLTIFKKYWAEDAGTRRKKLMPFLWNTVAAHGQIYGNRFLGNKVDVSNPYKFSYPGYSEIMCGWVDTAINKNEYKANPNLTLPEFFNQQPGLKGKVVAFTAWDAFNRILNEERSGIPVYAAYDGYGGKSPTHNQDLINRMLQSSHKEWYEESYDVFTHFGAMEELKTNKPRVLYIAYGETDEFAHGRQYRNYLDAANQVDGWIREIWEYVQSDPHYKNKTSLFITTDHGRGNNEQVKWTNHGAAVDDAE